MPSIETTVLNGLPVTVAFSWESDDPSVGFIGGAVDWHITHIAGKRCKKNPEWLYSRIAATAGEEERVQQECDAYEFPEYEDERAGYDD